VDNKNPVFSRLDQQTSSSSAGFAYAEGVTAYQKAGQQPGAAPIPAPYPTAPAGPPTGSVYEPITARMSLDDVLVRTGISLAVLIPMAGIGWMLSPTMPALVWIAMLVGMGLAFANIFKKQVSPPLVLAYAAVEGVFLGGISYFYQSWAEAGGYEGNLVSQAVIGTLVAFVVMLALYKSRLVKVDGRFMKIMMVAMVSYLVIALASFVSALFGVGGGWGFYGVGGLGILLCVAGVGLAAFSLMIDFESITRGVQAGLPERESWRMAFGLLVTLIWLYLEILRLLAIIAASRD
jgi:uncharacterized YccA/Bax inhibitor family protein